MRCSTSRCSTCCRPGDDIHQTGYSQPALFSLQYALTTLLASFGVVPDAVMGQRRRVRGGVRGRRLAGRRPAADRRTRPADAGVAPRRRDGGDFHRPRHRRARDRSVAARGRGGGRQRPGEHRDLRQARAHRDAGRRVRRAGHPVRAAQYVARVSLAAARADAGPLPGGGESRGRRAPGDPVLFESHGRGDGRRAHRPVLAPALP